MPSELTTPFFVFLLSLARIMAIFRTAPFLGGKAVAANIRNSVAITIVFLVYPIVQAQAPQKIVMSPHLGMLMAKEVLIGVIIGFLLGLLFWVAESTGFLIDNQRGASMASSVDPLSSNQSSPLGSVFFQAVVMLFFLSGAFVSFLGFLMQSYSVWPAFSFIPNLQSTALSDFIVSQINVLATSVVILAGPILILCFLSDFGLGLINRFAPQLNVFFLAMPVKSALAMFFLVIYTRVLMRIFKDRIDNISPIYDLLQRVFQ